MITIRTFLSVLDRHTLAVCLLSLASTFTAHQLGLAAEMPTTIISIAVIFPIVFSINAAYARREEALRYLAVLRANAAGIYYAHRDWDGGDGDRARAAAVELCATMVAVRESLQSVAPAGPRRDAAVYASISALSRTVEGLRAGGLSGTEVSRANQYLRGMLESFELLRNIASYRTPVPLRAYSHVFLNAFPILFGPYFAHIGDRYYPVIGYLIAALYAVVLVSLDNIQEELENPFDSRGSDDVRLDELDAFIAALEPPVPSATTTTTTRQDDVQ